MLSTVIALYGFLQHTIPSTHVCHNLNTQNISLPVKQSSSLKPGSCVWAEEIAWYTLSVHAPDRAGIPARLGTIVHICITQHISLR